MSIDCPVGAPFNIFQYALLLSMLAHVSDMEVGEFIWTLGDAHIYNDQLASVPLQLARTPLPLPRLWLNPEVKNLFEFTMDDIQILDYTSHEAIHYPVSV